MLARARSFHYLALLLAVVLAWPANFSILVRDLVSTSQLSPTNGHQAVGARFHRPERPTDVDQGDWSMIADNTEGSDGSDDFRYAPLATPHRPMDLPSLVPCPIESRQLDPTYPGTSFRLSPPLRC